MQLLAGRTGNAVMIESRSEREVPACVILSQLEALRYTLGTSQLLVMSMLVKFETDPHATGARLSSHQEPRLVFGSPVE